MRNLLLRSRADCIMSSAHTSKFCDERRPGIKAAVKGGSVVSPYVIYSSTVGDISAILRLIELPWDWDRDQGFHNITWKFSDCNLSFTHNFVSASPV